MSAADSFHTLLARVAPSETQRQRVATHRDTIASRLKSQFAFYKMLTIGSYARGTDIAGESDVDLFAVFTKDEVTWGNSVKSSTTMLDNVRNALEGRFPNTAIQRDVHAIVVAFSSGVRVDVVPAYFVGMTSDNRFPVYAMPDGSGGWMRVSPDAHASYISQADAQAAGKLRGTARIMKFWRSCRSPAIPLSSFHIEMILAQEAICAGVKTYATCFTELLMKLAARDCSALRDPLGIAGNIPAVKVPSMQQRVVDSVSNSRDHAKAAESSDYWGGTVEARRQWDIVFNGSFPK
ncbi:hypothetical protein DB347_25290 [Opitutaceae bacterium EW11]|nr:hypothetical protein DB347_25290 [Opitutaceae bacterium EW11]